MAKIRHVREADAAHWLRLRHALWPDTSEDQHQAEIQRFLSGRSREPRAVLVAEDEQTGSLVGLAELSVRPYAEGCDTDRVGYLEGWYVSPEFRRRGIARALVTAAESWAMSNGCTEFASDTEIDNEISAAAHRQCGFEEVAVIRCFRKILPTAK